MDICIRVCKVKSNDLHFWPVSSFRNLPYVYYGEEKWESYRCAPTSPSHLSCFVSVCLPFSSQLSVYALAVADKDGGEEIMLSGTLGGSVWNWNEDDPPTTVSFLKQPSDIFLSIRLSSPPPFLHSWPAMLHGWQRGVGIKIKTEKVQACNFMVLFQVLSAVRCNKCVNCFLFVHFCLRNVPPACFWLSLKRQ